MSENLLLLSGQLLLQVSARRLTSRTTNRRRRHEFNFECEVAPPHLAGFWAMFFTGWASMLLAARHSKGVSRRQNFPHGTNSALPELHIVRAVKHTRLTLPLQKQAPVSALFNPSVQQRPLMSTVDIKSISSCDCISLCRRYGPKLK